MNTIRNKRGKIDSSNKDEDHLEAQDNNKTQELIVSENVTVGAPVDVITVGELLENAVFTEQYKFLMFLINILKNPLAIFKGGK